MKSLIMKIIKIFQIKKLKKLKKINILTRKIKIYNIYRYPDVKNKPIYEDRELKNLFNRYPKEFIIEFCEKFKNLMLKRK